MAQYIKPERRSLHLGQLIYLTEPLTVASLNQRSINHLRRLHHHLALPRWKAKKIEAQLLKEWEERAAPGPQPGGPAQQSPSAGDR